MKKYVLLLLCAILFSSITSAYYYSGLSDEEERQLDQMLPTGYDIVQCKQYDLTGDGKIEYWVIANKNVDLTRDYIKLIVYSKQDDSFNKIWESKEIYGSIVKEMTDDVEVNGSQYVHVQTINQDSGKYQFWLFQWNGTHAVLINEPLSSDQTIYARVNEDKFEGLAAEEFVFIAYDFLEGGTRYNGYIIEGDKLILGDEYFEPKEVEPTYPSLGEIYPEIAQVVQSKYPGFQLEEHWDLYGDFDLIKIKSDESDAWWLVLELTYTDEGIGNAVIKYALDKKYSNFYYPQVDADVNNDGYLEICLFDGETLEYDWIYILSIKPDGATLVSPVDEEGFSLIVKHNWVNYIEFEDINGDGLLDLKTSADRYGIDHWLWDPKLGSFKFDKVVYE